MTSSEKTTYVVVAPGGHYHDAYAVKDRSVTEQHLVLDADALGAWMRAARFAESAAEATAAAALLPAPVSRHGSYADARTDRDRRNNQPVGSELIITARIRVPVSELKEAGCTTDDLLEGIKYRLHPVVSCHPDEMTSSEVTVTLEAVTASTT